MIATFHIGLILPDGSIEEGAEVTMPVPEPLAQAMREDLALATYSRDEVADTDAFDATITVIER